MADVCGNRIRTYYDSRTVNLLLRLLEVVYIVDIRIGILSTIRFTVALLKAGKDN